MPRKASDKTVTHRIELGITERAKLDEILTLQKENQRIDGITATLQAAGSALAGGGLLWAAIAAAAFLAPGLVDSCLLYTSPSPRDGLLSRMPSSA